MGDLEGRTTPMPIQWALGAMGSSEPRSLFCLVCVVELLLVLPEVDHTLDKANEEGGEWRHEEEPSKSPHKEHNCPLGVVP